MVHNCLLTPVLGDLTPSAVSTVTQIQARYIHTHAQIMKMMVMIIILAINISKRVNNECRSFILDKIVINIRTINILINVLLDPNQGTTNICFSIMM